MNKLKLLALLVGMVMLLVIPSTVSAQRVPPHVFVVTSVNGAAPADGAVIGAMVGGAEVASAVAAGGQAVVTVDQEDQSFSGMMVSFTVNGATTSETMAWLQGGADILTLTTTGVAPAPTAVPAATQDPSMAGPAGPEGRRGATGAAGPAGAEGARGGDGPGGQVGPAGAAGPAGASGPAGAEGPAGNAGAAGPEGDSGGGALAVVALILAIVAILGAGGAFMLGRRT